jgi:hypothetical protein
VTKAQNARERLPLKIEFDPPKPKAGQEFKIIVTLDGSVEGEPLTLKFEKQRFKFIPKPGEFPELRPTGTNYFDLDPSDITVEVGKHWGESKAAVRKDAKDNDTGNPILFPDNLVLTYFVVSIPEAGTADRYCAGIVKIEKP